MQKSSLLGIDTAQSALGRQWLSRPLDERLVAVLAQSHGLPEIIARLLAARGVAAEAVDDFLEPSLRKLLPDPSHLKDMDKAAARLAQAIMGAEKVAVFGDYDVDGGTSSALLRLFFAAQGRPLTIYIPGRHEGYGPNAPALAQLQREGHHVIVTVDCGTTAFEPLAAAAAGQEVIVIDHHAGEPQLPRAFAVVNPNRMDETSPHKHLAACGMTFLLVVAVNRALRQAGWYNEARPEPDLRQWLDLVAVGTICDVVSLTGVNRALVVAGLKVMAQRKNAGLAALSDVAGVDRPPDDYVCGFMLGPRINAGGRIGKSDLGARLLSTDDPIEARQIAEQLDLHNQERKALDSMVLEAAAAQLEAQMIRAGGEVPPVLIAAAEGWHKGVIGIAAGRLKERFNRPVCVIAIDEDGIGTASCRSVDGVDLGAAVIAARQAGILRKGGGHAMAAGFEVEAARISELQAFLIDHVQNQLGGAAPAASFRIDGVLQVGAANVELLDKLEKMEPFGAGNPKPRFAIAGAQLVRAVMVGIGGHVSCTLMGPDGARLNAIAFRAADTPLGQLLLKSKGRALHLIGTLSRNRYNGAETAQLIIDDAALAAEMTASFTQKPLAPAF